MSNGATTGATQSRVTVQRGASTKPAQPVIAIVLHKLKTCSADIVNTHVEIEDATYSIEKAVGFVGSLKAI